MTQILSLPRYRFAMEIPNNQSWLDAWAYVDAGGKAISLDGLTLLMLIRKQASDPIKCLTASNVFGLLPKNLPSGRISVGGLGRNVLALNISPKSVLALEKRSYVFEVQANGDGITRTIAEGTLNVTQGLIR